jgi:hypothetical protein
MRQKHKPKALDPIGPTPSSLFHSLYARCINTLTMATNSTSSMNLIVIIVLLLINMVATRAPNGPLLDSYDYIGTIPDDTMNSKSALLTSVQLLVVDQVA